MSNLSDRFSQYGLDLASSGTEYLSWDAVAGATSYSPAGQALPTAAVNRDLVAGSAIQSADMAILEVRPSSASPEWVPASEQFPYHQIGSSIYGMRVVHGAGADDGVLRVEFGADGAESGKTWSTANGEGWQWRLRRVTQSNVSNPDVPLATRNESTGDKSVGAGYSLSHPYLQISTADTYTVAGRLLVAEDLTSDGELIVTGDGEVVIYNL